jgi:hypothetical protein
LFAFFLFGIVHYKESKLMGMFDVKNHAADEMLDGRPHATPTTTTTTTTLLLSRQIRIQQEFQQLVRESQTPKDCSDARILLVNLEEEYDGFALEVRFMSYFLQIAVATGRALVVAPIFTSAYAPRCNNNDPTDATNDPPAYKSGDEAGDESGDEASDKRQSSIELGLLDHGEEEEDPGFEKSSDVASDGRRQQRGGGGQREEEGPKGGRWSCLWKPVSNCTADQNIGGIATGHVLPEPMGIGILENEHSHYFDAKFYGPQRIEEVEMFMHGDRTKLVDVIPHWERVYGRYWIRAQISDYFWKYATDASMKEINSRLPRTLLDLNKPYIGFHIRMTDNVGHLAGDFGRNATVTRSFGRFMEIANNIRKDHPTLKHVYVATDNEHAAAAALKGGYPNWKFHIQNDVKRSKSGSDVMWFKDFRAGTAGLIGADIETLRRADFLIGSFQSNVYRLAAELNTGYHTSRYLWDQKRIYAVDIEWYEDP